jgi:hypothetical protein
MDPIERDTASLLKAERQLKQLRESVKKADQSRESESEARQLLVMLRSLMDHVEDTALFEPAHDLLDQAGKFVRETYGCLLERVGTTYYETCPVTLAHVRLGFSVGVVVKARECSICGQDPEDCEHIKGVEYGGHMCSHRLTELALTEVSLVARPAQPDARILRISVPIEELRTALGPGWSPGIEVSCDKCLTPCRGVSRPLG